MRKRASQYVIDTYNEIIDKIIIISERGQLDTPKHQSLCKQLHQLHKLDMKQRGVEDPEKPRGWRNKVK